MRLAKRRNQNLCGVSMLEQSASVDADVVETKSETTDDLDQSERLSRSCAACHMLCPVFTENKGMVFATPVVQGWGSSIRCGRKWPSGFLGAA